ncbi:MAG: hypothetical protein ACXW18_08010 [Pyrinomonadaceae bacterium]
MKNRSDENDSASDDATDVEPQENTEDESSADDLSPYEPKRGERPDNLQRRSDWFQKRTGGK